MIEDRRCALLVPDAPTDGVSRAVEVEVRLPPEGRRLPGEFPALTWYGNAGRVTLGHVPAFVLAPHAAAGMPESWWQTLDTRRAVDLGALALVAAATALWIWRQRRPR